MPISQSQGRLGGVEPIEDVVMMEDHNKAYFTWQKAGIKNRILLHLDAHIDFSWMDIKEPQEILKEARDVDEVKRMLEKAILWKRFGGKRERLVNIGNYIYPAMRDGIVSDFYWVIPGDRREFGESLKNLKNILRSFFPRDPFQIKRISAEKGRLKANIYGRNFTFTTLEDLPEDIDGALLDIDIDYLTTDTIRKANVRQDVAKRFPWIWPEELVGKLKRKRIEPSYITVAYSVNGGFTPIIYKFLGDEIGAFFKGTSDELTDTIHKKNEAIGFFKKRRFKEAINILEGLFEDLNCIKKENSLKNKLKAHICFLLFRCYAKLNYLTKAKRYYNLSAKLDKAYRAKDNNYGPLYLNLKGKLKEAEDEFKIILSADRNNSYALCGVANILMRRRNFKKAKIFFKKAFVQDKKNQEALLGLGRSELLLKNYKGAIRYLKEHRSKNRMEGIAHSLLACAYEKLGKIDEALKEYKSALCFSIDLNLYLKFFRLLKKIGIPKDHSLWIKGRINTYKNYRKNFLKLKKKHFKKQGLIAMDRTKSYIKRIDRIVNSLQNG